jgi:2-keto-3-deoxy-L-rhamnonate aldolase RhmA
MQKNVPMTTRSTDRPTLSAALRSGNCTGGWCGFASVGSVDLMAHLGYDFLLLDLQHCEITMPHVPALLGAIGSTGPYSVVRVAQNDYHSINWLFDQGVDGVLVPMVNSVADARRAVEAAKFPPVGRRSFGPFRAARYGIELDTYIPNADNRSALIIQIEDYRAVDVIDEILGVEGIDGVFMGPNDLGYSLLKPGQSFQGNAQHWSAFTRTPEVISLCEHVMKRCNAAGMPFGMTTPTTEEAQSWLQRGAQFVTFGSDWLFLRAGWQHLTKSKAQPA